MSRNGHSNLPQRHIPVMEALPRPLFARSESLPERTTTPRHSHPWAQLSYATSGVLRVHTDAGRFLAPPQRAILIPPGLLHEVISSPHTEMRSLYIDYRAVAWAPAHCQVLAVSPLLRELIRAFGELPVEYDQRGADGRLATVLLDQLQAAPEIGYSLPWPRDPRLRELCEALYAAPDIPFGLAHWSARLGVAEKTLTRQFQRDTGLSFRAWRQRLRLLSALPLLEQGQPVTDVALACGYESTSAFIAAFGLHFGYTPGNRLNASVRSANS
ncbi:helix-turn-helix transcriptional regulator [Stutzerimonas stutzeri]|uniref:AraC family transcriptional regulator n=1 Tax=Stutzerimonas sp. S1 TaxID=3030652 RepID=UPI002224A919|nr:helix-turn-helix transcriptional regulator [Stutzerimonas sp. S1]MCW3150525.1 helix-turn-helix transcriptional regulator [Stutzerimonas sp. S1]